jgi:hypothetical protein
MKLGNGTNRYAYNAQAIADAKEGVIVACEVRRQETDTGALVPMIEQAHENLGAVATTTVADSGYGAGADLQAAAEQGFSVLAAPAEGTPAQDNPYAAQHFRYDALAASVTCPEGRRLDHEGHTTKHGVRAERYRCHWRDCPVRARCTSDPKGRQIEVWPHTATVQAMRQRLREPGCASCYQRRGEIIEPRFGQIKAHDGFRRWTVWGLATVQTQWAMLCATLNLRVLYRRWKQSRPVPMGWPAAMRASAACWPFYFSRPLLCNPMASATAMTLCVIF